MSCFVDLLLSSAREDCESGYELPQVSETPTVRLPETPSITFEATTSSAGEQTHIAYRWLLGGCSYAFDLPRGWGLVTQS
ncbi:hypothetical protein AB0392_04145 [Nonomuraea angiospora]|uniref:hypothetical protein n=1 Tax=Nonomuraea angiospora TaxID=46172 RepID=UPI0034503A6C